MPLKTARTLNFEAGLALRGILLASRSLPKALIIRLKGLVLLEYKINSPAGAFIILKANVALRGILLASRTLRKTLIIRLRRLVL